jgi:hypothetical protein
MTWDIDDLLGIDEPDDLNTDALYQAKALTDAERAKNIEATKLARDNIMAQVDVDVEDSDFGFNLDKLTDYARYNAGSGSKQTAMTASRMGVDIDPTLQATMDRQASLGSARTGVDTRNTQRVIMREDRMDNMAKAIGMEDDLLQMELDRLKGEQDLANIEHGMPSNGSSFSIGGAIKGGIAGYKATGNPVVGAFTAVLGAFL